MKTSRLPLPAPAPGHQRFLTVHEFGEGGHKAYLQAGLHADEWPGLLTLQHLLQRLIELEQAGKLRQRIVIVPYANPIGMSQRLFGKFPGRFDAVTGQNFNRGMSICSEELIRRLGDRFTNDGTENSQRVRRELVRMVQEKDAVYEIELLHKTLLGLSIDTSVMLDLHCDDNALPHLFYGEHQRDIGQRLGDCLGYPIRLEEDVRGVVAFDGTHSQPWVKLMDESEHPFDRPCFAATLELRGQTDVSESRAARDAEGILAFLDSQGFVEQSGARQQPGQGESLAIDVSQVKVVPATANGIVVYHRELGDSVRQGEHLADILLLDADGPERVPVQAPANGILFSRTQSYLTYPGAGIGMIASDSRQIEPGTQLSF